VCYADLFEILRSIDFPAGVFRAAAVDIYRPTLGVGRAEAWGLPLDFQAVIADDGSDPSDAASLVRTARAAVPTCSLGSLGSESVDPLWTKEITDEVNLVFQFLGLPRLERTTELKNS
jgi:hypothetical protein